MKKMRSNYSIEEVQQYLQQLRDNPSLPTGYREWDALTGGLVPGELTLIGSRPAMGRSSLALNIADHISKQFLGTVAIISPQESENEVAVRLLQIGTGMQVGKLLDGSIPAEDAVRACRSFLTSRCGNIEIIRPRILTLAEILWSAEQVADLKLLIVDNIEYIHKPVFPSTIPNDVKVYEAERVPMDRLIRCLKRMAQILNVPVICTAYLHRSLENRKDKRPRLKDLEKINVPVDIVDQVVFLYRDRYYDLGNHDTAECIITKSPNGQTGTVQLQWNPKTGEFRELENS